MLHVRMLLAIYIKTHGALEVALKSAFEVALELRHLMVDLTLH